jgi:hypothetical protein
MEVIYFVAFVAMCAVILLAVGRASRKKHAELARKQKEELKKAHFDKLSTPSNYLLARSHDIWHSKRNKAAEDVIVTNRYAPRSQSAGEAEYDGYSRRDRHHVFVGSAHIKEADHVAEPRMSEIEYKESKGTR